MRLQQLLLARAFLSAAESVLVSPRVQSVPYRFLILSEEIHDQVVEIDDMIVKELVGPRLLPRTSSIL